MPQIYQDMKKIAFIAILAMLVVSCKEVGTTKVSATGSIYECLVVAPSTALSQEALDLIRSDAHLGIQSGSAYDEPISTGYDLIKAVMAAPMPCMPQVEPYFKVTHVPPAAFDNILKPSRNILIVDINPERYTSVKAKQVTDVWAHPQAVCRVQAPDMEALVQYWLQHGEVIRDWFVQQEMRRQLSFYRAATNKEGRKVLHDKMHLDLWIPQEYMLIDTIQLGCDVEALWYCNNKGAMRRDLVVYSYPYITTQSFDPEALNAKRDEVLGSFISATVPGSYMGTEYKVFPPQSRHIEPLFKDSTYDPSQFYGVEVRGLWKMYAGEAMGGPYVSISQLDEVHQRVVTAEVYVFAPGQKKRNALRQAEAILYSWEWMK